MKRIWTVEWCSDINPKWDELEEIHRSKRKVMESIRQWRRVAPDYKYRAISYVREEPSR